MEKQFIKFIENEGLADGAGTILLGVSGGVDSMVMMELFRQAGYNIAAAHCNFGLRGDESDQDALFVEEQCRKNKIPVHSKLFDTAGYSKERGISLQMAARDLRYAWFDTLLTGKKYSSVAIAHNKNDLAETFLINLIRGTGIRGLTGIKAKTGNIIRPLLFAERDEILVYAERYKIPYREDSSNQEVKYKRNRIRHRIIPEFDMISSSFVHSVYETALRLKDVETIYASAIEKTFEKLCTVSGQEYRVNIRLLLALDPLPSYLFEFLRRWEFPRELIPDIIASLNASPGKQFYSHSHRLVKDRDHLIITPVQAQDASRYYIEEGVTEITSPIKLRISKLKNHQGLTIPATRKIAFLDMNMLLFPLILRKWEKGDYFQPLGLNGLKKLSDFFIDNKFSLVEKEKTWLLASGNRLVWIIGHRIDDRFRVTERTEEIIRIEVTD